MPRLEEFITLEEAAEKYNLDKALLTELVEAGRIKAGKLDGTIVLAEADVRRYIIQRQKRKRRNELHQQRVKRQIEQLREKYSHLAGRTIGAYKAEEIYGIRTASLYRWAKKGYIRVVEEGWGKKFDERDVAILSDLIKQGKLRKGRALVYALQS